MQSNLFFQAVERDLCSSVENCSVDSSIDSTVDYVDQGNNKNEKRIFKNLKSVEYPDSSSSVSGSLANDSPQKRALHFLGLKKKNVTNALNELKELKELKGVLQNKIRWDNDNTQDFHSLNKVNIFKRLDLSDSLHKDSKCAEKEGEEKTVPSENISIFKNEWKYESQRESRNKTKTKKEQRFYCLNKIVWNGLNNNYDNSKIKICNIYHDSTLECMFDDLSRLVFYGKKNICIYKNASYNYNEINDQLFFSKKKEKVQFEPDRDIYEYMYKKQIELNQLKNIIKGEKQVETPNNRNDKSINKKISSETSGDRTYKGNEIQGKNKLEEKESIQCFQFHINKFPYFLKDKVKVATHLYNLFSTEPYANHEYVEKGMYFMSTVKIVHSIEKVIYVKWKLYEKERLQTLLKNIMINIKNKNVSDGNFVNIDNSISINFLTQEVKIQDLNNSEELKDKNYIILNGNGLCFSAYYHVLVPFYRHVNKEEKRKEKKKKFVKNERNNKERNEQGDNFTLCYEYLYISQMFNIYDNFHISFFYPLWVSYFFYYHLFVKKKKEKLDIGVGLGLGIGLGLDSDVDSVLSFFKKEKQTRDSSWHYCYFERNKKKYEKKNEEIKAEAEAETKLSPDFESESKWSREKKEYNNNDEISYLVQLEDLFKKLNLCFETIMVKKKEYYKRIGNDAIEFALPSSCFQRSSNAHFISELDKTHVNMLYMLCINKYNSLNYEANYGTHSEVLMEVLNNRGPWKKKFCFNEIREMHNLRSLFPNSSRSYFNSCSKIDNIIKISLRGDGVCFFYIKDFRECVFYSFFIIFNSLQNLFMLNNINREKEKRRSYSSKDNEDNKSYVFLPEQSKIISKEHFRKMENKEIEKRAKKGEQFNFNVRSYCSNTSLRSILTSFQNEEDKPMNTLNYATRKYAILNSQYQVGTMETAEIQKFPSIDTSIGTSIGTSIDTSIDTSIGTSIGTVFEMDNMKSVYNDFYICENKKMNTFKLINIIDKKKKKILAPYYFDRNDLTEFFFFHLSNVHIFDINKHLNTVYDYINYHNATYTPFLRDVETSTTNVDLDLLENMYSINNELYLLYIKKINYSHDIYRYTYLYVQNYLMKNYFLYNNMYLDRNENFIKNNYYKLKYTNEKKQTISIHFTISFNYVYENDNKNFPVQAEYYITHVEKQEGEFFDESNYLSFIEKYTKTKERN